VVQFTLMQFGISVLRLCEWVSVGVCVCVCVGMCMCVCVCVCVCVHRVCVHHLSVLVRVWSG